MKRKIIKYTKFIVSMVLILGLIAPSYASLSASDGSAFVTKAEFDSALADFNSRLTTFEAGINSKIDSQVTSYLDRNGIWNGKIMVDESNKMQGAKIGIVESGGTVANATIFLDFGNVDGNTSIANQSLQFPSCFPMDNGNYDLNLGIIPKSGLCVMKYDLISPHDGLQVWFAIGLKVGTVDWNQYYFDATWNWQMMDGDLVASASLVQLGDSDALMHSIHWPSRFNNLLLGFVTKGNMLSLRCSFRSQFKSSYFNVSRWSSEPLSLTLQPIVKNVAIY